VESAKRILNAGAEKIVLSSAAVEDPSLISELASHFGSQSVVASIDYRNTFLSGPRVFARGGTRRTKRDPVEWAREVERRGAGEIIVNAIERDGTGKGFDLDTVRKVSGAVNVPVVALGGAGCTEDFIALFRETAASGGAAGRLFVYHGSPDSILINYPCREEKFRVFRESERIRSEKTS
jgi:cyclase